MKNKISLLDYNFSRDIENRLLMSQLTVFEVDVMREILDGSLKFSIYQLAEVTDADECTLIPILDKFAQTKLLKRTGSEVQVDKEMRKYYEVQILKFDENFLPDMDFLQSLLSKVPIQVLPIWYAIPRTSDNIFLSILEKHFATPKIYEKYLQEIQFDDPVLGEIQKDVFSAPEFLIDAEELRSKYGLSQEQFEKAMLLLEYNLVCCLSYRKKGKRWQEVVTPFHEWKEYLTFIQKTTPEPILDSKKVVRRHPHDFGFIQVVSECLEILMKDVLKEGQNKFPRALLQRLVKLNLIEIRGGEIYPLEAARKWLSLSTQDKAIMLYRQPLDDEFPMLYAEKDIREIERSLKKVVSSGWIYFEDFVKGITASICGTEGVVFKKKGKRWGYALPSYREEEIALVKSTLFQRLYEAGMLAVGVHQNKPCFCVTPFGRVTLGD